MTKLKFKKDKFNNARKGGSKLLELNCRKCNSLIAVYQKDGPGSLLRLYLDRICSPDKLVNLQKKSIKEILALRCEKCHELIGTPYIYEKENRKAFRLYHDAVVKKIRKL